MTKERNLWFDLFRGLCALAVSGQHLRAMMFCDFGEVTSPSSSDVLFYMTTRLGQQAVMVFFVLSGYFVGGSVIRNKEHFSFLDYSIARISRLWTVLIPALLFTLILDSLVGLYSDALPTSEFWFVWGSDPPPNSYSISLATFLANLFFLQTVYAPTFGSNGPLWSLANEFWYYLVFPLLVCGFKRNGSALSVLSLLIGIAIVFALPVELALYGVIWSFGVIAFAVSRHTAKVKWHWVSTLAAFAIFAAAVFVARKDSVRDLAPLAVDCVVGLSFAGLIIVLAHQQLRVVGPLKRLIEGLSDMSFSLYLFHYPIVVAIGVLVIRNDQYQPSVVSFAVFGSLLFAIVLFCWGAWYLFERNTNLVRRGLIGLFGRGQTPHPQPLSPKRRRGEEVDRSHPAGATHGGSHLPCAI